MATIKLKKKTSASGPALAPKRAPVRGSGSGVRNRPTLAEAQSRRAEREAEYQAQLPQRASPQSPSAGPRRRDDRVPDHPDRRPGARPPVRPPVRPPARPAARPPARPAARPPTRFAPTPAPTPAPAPARSPARPASASPQALRRPFDRGNPPGRNGPPGAGSADRSGVDRSSSNRFGSDDDDDDDLPAEHPPGSMRLSKRMSELGIASRREADEWIAKGWVRVDDHVASVLGSRVMPGQRVTVDAQAKYQQAQKVTVLVNKPVGYVSGQAEDCYEPALVLVTPANQWRDDRSGTRFLREHTKNLVPAGRLDIDSVGLLVLTQDGRVAKQLIGEESEIEKEYLVRVASAALPVGAGNELGQRHGAPFVPERDLERLRHGLELDGEALLPATVEWVNADQLRFVLRQGKKRQIRRMCEAVGLQVVGLKRVRIGQVVLGDLPAGQWRYLRRDEAF